MSEKCKGCAFKEGTEANKQADTHIRALICVLSPSPFYCHESVDLEDERLRERVSPSLLREIKPSVCQGWREEVKQLAATGYYKQNPEATKAFGQCAFETLSELRGETDKAERKILMKQFTGLFAGLAKKWKKFRDKSVGTRL